MANTIEDIQYLTAPIFAFHGIYQHLKSADGYGIFLILFYTTSNGFASGKINKFSIKFNHKNHVTKIKNHAHKIFAKPPL